VKSLLQFNKFLVITNVDLVRKYILRKKNKQRFCWCMFVWKYCQLFTHEWNRFLF